MTRSPIKRKRETPRRNEGRIIHKRMRPRAKAAPTAEEHRHMAHVVEQGCVVCRRPAECHHVMSAPGKVRRRDHRFVIGLCPEHHRTGWGAVHALGSEAAFLETHGVDLVALSIAAWEARGA